MENLAGLPFEKSSHRGFQPNTCSISFHETQCRSQWHLQRSTLRSEWPQEWIFESCHVDRIWCASPAEVEEVPPTGKKNRHKTLNSDSIASLMRKRSNYHHFNRDMSQCQSSIFLQPKFSSQEKAPTPFMVSLPVISCVKKIALCHYLCRLRSVTSFVSWNDMEWRLGIAAVFQVCLFVTQSWVTIGYMSKVLPVAQCFWRIMPKNPVTTCVDCDKWAGITIVPKPMGHYCDMNPAWCLIFKAS